MGRRGRGRGRGRVGPDQQWNDQNPQHWNSNGQNRGNNIRTRRGGGRNDQERNTPWNNQNSNQQYKQNQKTSHYQSSERLNQFPSQHQVQKSIQCGRCEKQGHTESSCTAKEIPVDSRCPCGNAFHYQNQCPYEGDIFKRDDEMAKREGKFCTWCKDTGDGRHSFDECTKASDFKLNIRRIQREAYDVLDFCWHCGNFDHKTKACTKAQAQLDRELWAAKIVEVMEEWKKYSNATLRTAYFDNERDQQMSDVRDRRSPPLAAHYPWCILCEVFGHVTGEKVGGCEMEKFEDRCPPEHRFQLTGARSFTPKGFQPPSAQVNSSLVVRGSGHDYTLCSTAGCNKTLGPWTFPMPPLGQTIICPNCNTPQYHPSLQQPTQLGQLGVVKDVVKDILEVVLGSKASGNPTKAKVDPEILAMYAKRPSLRLQWSLAHRQKLGFVGAHDAHSYRYTDGSRQGAWSPVMWEDGRYFNADWQGGGNYQEYFPAITFQITPSMWADAKNDALPINRVGRQGLVPMCTGCLAPILVLDDEDDVVMCDTAWANTLGEGTGKGYYRLADGTYNPQQCECLWMIGQQGVVGWENGRTGEWVGSDSH